MKQKIEIESDGITDIHIAFTGGGYETLCGMNGDDPDINQVRTANDPHGKVSCDHCKQLATEGALWDSADFSN